MSRKKEEWEAKYQEVVDCYLRSLELCERQKEGLEGRLKEEEERREEK